MAKRLSGKELADGICADLALRSAALQERGVTPTLAMLRLGEEPGDLAYARGAARRAAQAGVLLRTVALPRDVSKERLLQTLDELNQDVSVHGVLLLRPLPEALRPYESAICDRLRPEKDVDGMTSRSAAGVYGVRGVGFAPCTAQAVLELLDYYGISCARKRAAVLGRSLVIGRPVAMLLLERNATVTVCHSKTTDIPEICRQADIVVTAIGVPDSFGPDCAAPHQVVVDVAMNVGPNGLTGDAQYDRVAPIVEAITPVPGGVGSVTSSVLMKHTVEAAEHFAG